jgi:hypothetical protein
VTLSANASDNQAVAGVQFQIDGVNFGTPITTAPYARTWDTTTVATGGHTITAIATDTSGNTASANVSVTVTTSSGDKTAPTVTITAPINNSTWAGTITLAANASDNVAVASVQFAVDGVNVGSAISSAPYQYNWNSAGLADATHTITATATDTSGNKGTNSVTLVLANQGQFGPVINTPAAPVTGVPVVPMHAILLNNGKVLFYDGGPDCLGGVSPTLWDPATNTFLAVPLVTVTETRDLFCTALITLADGRVLTVGGHECAANGYLGTAYANVFDPTTNKWTFLPNLNDRRWYPTATLLPDGRALVTAGSAVTTTGYDPIPEVYDPVANTWTLLSGANQVIPNYAFMFVLPNGNVLAAGSDEAKMATYQLNVATQTWSVVDSTILDAGSAVQYLPGKIMKTGSSYLSPPKDNGGSTPSAATTYVMDTNQSNPKWQQTASMANPRTHLNLTILPDGNVLATGGSTDIGGVNPANAVYQAELWSPVTQTWSPMASETQPRLYHSTALLLPDGRVAVMGGGHNYFNNITYPNLEVYSPAYLFKGARPTITSSPPTVTYGSNFFVGTPDAADIASVALIHTGAVTHSFNMEQNYVPLSFTQTTGGLTVTAPANANLATAGEYMLFIVNKNGVPAIAPFLQIPLASTTDTTPPSTPTGLTATASGGSVSLSWTASTDNVGVTGYNVYRSTVSGFTPSPSTLIASPTGTSYTDTSLTAGTYYYKVTAKDAAGNVSSPSTQASATVSGDTIAPTVSLTAPANGATVTGTVTVSANASDNVGVVGVQFLLDGVNLGSEVTAAPYNFSWNTASTINGTHTLAARARDAAGNQTTSASITVTVNNTTTTSGLVAAYGFNEGSGTTVTDLSGSGHTGTIANATWTTGGKYGNALSFNGSNAWVTINDAADLRLTAGMTVEAWVNPTVNASKWSAAIVKEQPSDPANDIAYALYTADGSGKPPAVHGLFGSGGGADKSAVGTSTLPLNTWTHLAGTYDGTALRLYVNGALVATKAQTGSMTTTTGALRIGGDASNEFFTGLIDEVRVYNRALSQTEIQNDMGTPLASGPSVTSTTPAAGATNVATTTTAQAVFNKAVVASTISFTLKDAANNPVTGSVAYNATTNTATFTSSASLANSTTYTATVSGAQDSSGNTMTPVSWSFTTIAAAGPAITSTSPAAGATNVATNSTVQAVFNKAVVASTISFTLKDAANNPISGAVAYNASTNTATFTPSALLATSTTFTATVSGAQDSSGNTMSPVSWSFTTEAAPALTSQTPASGATNVAVSTTVQAVFNKAIQSSTLSFVLKNASGTTIASTVAYNASTNTATLTPIAALANSTTYTVTVSGAQDSNGNAMAPVSWSFTTAAATTPSGLVAAYSFNEGSGTTVTDLSGNGHTGTIANATWTTAGKYGNALSFNGTNAWVTINDAADLHLTTGMTLEAWVNSAATNNWRSAILKEGTGSLAYALYATAGSSNPPAGYVRVGGVDQDATGTSVLTTSVWTHLATTYDGSNLRLYVNGTLLKTTAVSGTIVSSTGALRIGGNSIWGEYFSGLIDEVRVYNRALSQTEIQADMGSALGAGGGALSIPVGPSDPATTGPVTASLGSTTTVSLAQFLIPTPAKAVNFLQPSARGNGTTARTQLPEANVSSLDRTFALLGEEDLRLALATPRTRSNAAPDDLFAGPDFRGL